jgi:hypothetical protein
MSHLPVGSPLDTQHGDSAFGAPANPGEANHPELFSAPLLTPVSGGGWQSTFGGG